MSGLNIYKAKVQVPNTLIADPLIPGQTLPINEQICPRDIIGLNINGATLTPAVSTNKLQPYSFHFNKDTGDLKFAIPNTDPIANIKNKQLIDVFFTNDNHSNLINRDAVRDVAAIPLKGQIEIERSLENHPNGSIRAILNSNQRQAFKAKFKPGSFITICNIPFYVLSYNIRSISNNESPIRNYEATVRLAGKWNKFINKPVKVTSKPSSSYGNTNNSNNLNIDNECVSSVEDTTATMEHKRTITKIELNPLISKLGVSVNGLAVYYPINAGEELDTYVSWHPIALEQGRVKGYFVTYSEPNGINFKSLTSTNGHILHEIDIMEDQGTTVQDDTTDTDNLVEDDYITDNDLNDLTDDDLNDYSITNEDNLGDSVECDEFNNNDGLENPDNPDDPDNPPDPDEPDEPKPEPDPEPNPDEKDNMEEEDESDEIEEEDNTVYEITGDFKKESYGYGSKKTNNKVKTLPVPRWRKKPPVIITTREGDVNAKQPPVGTATGEMETWDLSLNFDQGGVTKTVRESTTYNGSPFKEESWTYGFMYMAADMAGIDKDGYPVAKKGYAPQWGLIRHDVTIHSYDAATGYYLGYTSTSKQTRRFKQEDTQNPESIWTAMERLTINKQLQEGVFYDTDGSTRPLTQDDRDLFDRDIRYMEKVRESITFKQYSSRTVNKLQIVDYGQFYDDVQVDNLVPYKVCLPNGTSTTQYAVDPSVIIPAFVIAEMTETSAFASMENPENIYRKYEFDKDMESDKPQPSYADSEKKFVPLPKLTTGEDSAFFRELTIYAKGKSLQEDFFTIKTNNLDRYTEFTSDYAAQDGQFIASAVRKTFREYVGRPGEATRRDLGWERIDANVADNLQENQPSGNSSTYAMKQDNQLLVGTTGCYNFNGSISAKQLTNKRLFLSKNFPVDVKYPNIQSFTNEFAETPEQAITAFLTNQYISKIQGKAISTVTVALNLNIKELDNVTIIRKKATLTGRVLSVRHIIEIGAYNMGNYEQNGSSNYPEVPPTPIALGLQPPDNTDRPTLRPQSFLKAYTQVTIGVAKCSHYNVILAPINDPSTSQYTSGKSTGGGNKPDSNVFKFHLKQNLELGATLIDVKGRRFGV